MPFPRFGKQAGESLRSIGALSTVGLAFVLAIVIGAWAGNVVDRWFGTSPFFFILFFFLGLAAGVLNVYRTVSKAYTPTRVPPPGQTTAPGPPTEPWPWPDEERDRDERRDDDSWGEFDKKDKEKEKEK